jgi:hypothetical protein
MSRALLLILICTLAGEFASARVFNFSDLNVAAYFRGTGGMHMMGQEGFSLSSGDESFFNNNDKPYFNYSGEIGLLFQLGETVIVRMGVEGLQSREIDAAARNASDQKLLDVNSKIVAFIPNLTLEFQLANGLNNRTYFFAGAGYVQIKGTNEYTMTAQGTSDYGGATDYKETVAGFALMGQGGLGFEFLFVDNCTLATEVGWRYLPVAKLKHEETLTTVQGPVTAGQTALNHDGSKRTYDMGGPFVGISLRFYIPPLD